VATSLPPPATPDLFHRYLDRRMRRARGLGNGSQFLFEVDGEVDRADLETRLAAAMDAVPLARSGMAPWPARRWVVGPDFTVPVTEEAVADGEDAVNAWFGRWFGEPFVAPESPSIQVVLGRAAGRTAVLVRWLHLLSDAPGMDLFLRLVDGEDPERFRREQQPAAVLARARGGRPAWRRFVDGHDFALRHALRSLVPPHQASVDPKARQTSLAATLTREETAALWARGRDLCGMDRNALLVGALARAYAEAFGVPGWRTLRIPVPISLRPPAWRGPVLGNWFTMLLVHVRVRDLGTLESAVAAVQADWRASLRRGADATTMAFMAPAGILPPSMARLFLDGPRLRDGASVNTSWVSLKAGATGSFLGHPLRRAVISSSILARPGLAGVFAEAAGRLSVAVPGQGGDAARALHEALLVTLRGG